MGAQGADVFKGIVRSRWFPRRTMVPVFQLLTWCEILRTPLNRFSIILVDDSTRSRLEGSPSLVTVKVSSNPSRNEAAARG
jgi:hypothetical protein